VVVFIPFGWVGLIADTRGVHRHRPSLSLLEEAAREEVLAEGTVDDCDEAPSSYRKEGLAKVPAAELGKVVFGPSGLESAIEVVKFAGAHAGVVEGPEVVSRVSNL
jgi:hypothetical protein